jgi:hypothetical protein
MVGPRGLPAGRRCFTSATGDELDHASRGHEAGTKRTCREAARGFSAPQIWRLVEPPALSSDSERRRGRIDCTMMNEATFAESASPLQWYEVAKLLHESACRLYRTRDQSLVRYTNHGRELSVERSAVNRPVFLLAGFSLENVLKAYVVYENPKYVSEGRLGQQLRTHKLTVLLDRCRQVPYKARHEGLMRIFEEGLNSWARYPCGLSATDSDIEGVLSERLWSRYERTFAVVSTKLERLLSRNWVGPHGTGGRVTFTSFA